MSVGSVKLERQVPEWRLWASLGILIIFYVMAYVDRALLPLMVEPIQADLGISDIQMGLLQGCAFTLIYAGSGLPLAWLADRTSRRRIIFWGSVVWSTSAMLCGLSRNFPMLFMARAAVGAGESGLAPSAQGLIASIFPRKKLAFAQAVYGQSSSLGGGLALAIGGVSLAALTARGGLTLPILGHLEAWQAMFFIAGLIGLPLSLLIWLVHEPRRVAVADGGQPPGTVREFMVLLKQQRRLVVAHMLGFPLCALVIYSQAAWMPAFLMRRHELDIAQVGLIIGILNMTFGAGGSLAQGLLSDWLARRGVHDAYYRVQMGGILIGGPALILAYLSPTPALAIACMAVFECTFSAFGGTAPAALSMMMPNSARSKLLALYWLTMGLMGCAGPLLTATLTTFLFHDRTMVGYSLVIVTAVFSPIAFGALWMGLKPLRQVVQVRIEEERLEAAAEARPPQP